MDGLQDLYAKRDELERLLEEGLRECRMSGLKLAENEAEYRKRLRIEILDMRRAGQPVTIIGDLCRGIEEIADLREARDSAEAIYRASLESINVNKLRLRMVDAEINRVWNSGGVNYGQ